MLLLHVYSFFIIFQKNKIIDYDDLCSTDTSDGRCILCLTHVISSTNLSCFSIFYHCVCVVSCVCVVASWIMIMIYDYDLRSTDTSDGRRVWCLTRLIMFFLPLWMCQCLCLCYCFMDYDCDIVDFNCMCSHGRHTKQMLLLI
jgi:hypothetical protein